MVPGVPSDARGDLVIAQNDFKYGQQFSVRPAQCGRVWGGRCRRDLHLLSFGFRLVPAPDPEAERVREAPVARRKHTKM